ncbi:MAG: CBS domain-containing protein [Thermofilaceae archaeon]|nr:CBS domain-containing protein [Thermofilaceae archaeon]MCX8181316.1 CBS domain-containing protein [Thermofilaceae archaeon]MDW8004659.1 CBS domain-containing protein [Thermofilaceae archaeon]
MGRRPKHAFVETLLQLDTDDVSDVAAELARRQLLVASTEKGTITLDSLISLASHGQLNVASVSDAVVNVPKITGRVGVSTILSRYVSLRSKYALVLNGVLTPRSLYNVASASIPVTQLMLESLSPAIVSPNATLLGALRRMRERGSVCAFVVRSGKLKGVIDAWSTLLVTVNEGKSGLEASCSDYLRKEPLSFSYPEFSEAIMRYGFAALIVGDQVTIVDDVSLYTSLVKHSSEWLHNLNGR